MNLRSLEALCAVSEANSLTAAARKLRISTAAISERLQTLERDLDAKLVIRSGRTMALTPAGDAVARLAEKILDHVRGLKQAAHSEKVGGKLRLGAIATALTSLLPAALKKIAEEFPNIELLVVPGTSDSLYAQMEAKSIDCAVMVQTPFRMSKQFDWWDLRVEPLVLLSHQDNFRRDIKTTIEQNRFIRIDRNDWTGQIVTRYLRDIGANTKDLFELNALETIFNLVTQKLGVAILPDWGLPKSGQNGMRIVPLPEAGYFRTIGLISAVVSPNAALVHAVLGVFQDLARQRRPRV
ncbi:MAG TPA: LysR family transcriptional regulator [Pseudolabrys sp.]|nr:LysR family transcriptional regulator [Pseudolabrys sp.]